MDKLRLVQIGTLKFEEDDYFPINKRAKLKAIKALEDAGIIIANDMYGDLHLCITEEELYQK